MHENEQIYLYTDCEVYAPGDTIWYKAYIRSKATLEKAHLSNVMHLILLNSQGTIMEIVKLVVIDA